MTTDGRPRVVILGGGFAGVGAAQKLKKAAADVVLIDHHDYHTFQPLLYQLATGLLETTGVGHSLRDLVHDQDNATVHKTAVTRARSRRAHGAVRRDGASELRLPGARARRGGQLLRHRRRGRARLPDVHALRCDASQGPRPRQVGGGGQEPGVDRRRRAQHRRRGGRPHGRRDRRRDGRALPRRLRARLPERAAGEGAHRPRRGGARGLLDVRAEHPRLHGEGAREAHGRGDDRPDRRLGRADTRDAQVG